MNNNLKDQENIPELNTLKGFNSIVKISALRA